MNLTRFVRTNIRPTQNCASGSNHNIQVLRPTVTLEVVIETQPDGQRPLKMKHRSSLRFVTERQVALSVHHGALPRLPFAVAVNKDQSRNHFHF